MSRRTKDRIFYAAATQFENLGDIVLAEEIVRRTRELGELLVDDRNCPAGFRALLGLRTGESSLRSGTSFKRRLLARALARRARGGGRVLYVLKPGHLRNRACGVKAHLYLAWLALLERLGVEIVRYGTSIELPNDRAAALERARARHFADYTLRDHASIALARGAGLSNVRYYPDLALGLPFSGGGVRDCLCASFRNDVASHVDRGRERCVRQDGRDARTGVERLPRAEARAGQSGTPRRRLQPGTRGETRCRSRRL